MNEISRRYDSESVQLQGLNKILKDLNNQSEPDHNLNSEANAVLEKLNSAQKTSDLNRARLDYLQVTHFNLEKCLKEKKDLIKILELQLDPVYPDSREIKILVDRNHDIDNETKTYKIDEETIEHYVNLEAEYETLNQVITEIDENEEFSMMSSIADNEIQQNKNEKNQTDDNISLNSIESSNTSVSTNSHEVMASFLRYKRIREKALEKNKIKSGAATISAKQKEYKDNSFNEVFNTVHYF